MAGTERAPERERPHAGERAPQQTTGHRPNEAAESAGEGRDAYGCVDWYDYCPLPRTDPPVRRRG